MWGRLINCILIHRLLRSKFVRPGLPFSFGTFRDYYEKQPAFVISSSIAIIGTLCTGTMYISALPIWTFYEWFPRYRKKGSFIGLAVWVIALVAASFANTINQLIALQGALYGLGAVFVVSPPLLYISDWFLHKRSMAFGVMWAGTGVFSKHLSSPWA